MRRTKLAKLATLATVAMLATLTAYAQPQLPGQGDAVHARHLIVEQRDVVGVALPDPGQGLRRRAGVDRLAAAALEPPGDDAAELRVVIDHQDGQGAT